MKPNKTLQLCLISLFCYSALFSQTPDGSTTSRGNTTKSSRRDFRLPLKQSFQDKDKRSLLKQREADFKLEMQAQALETAVDPQQYRVGPGDRFMISIWSTLENSIPASVTPAGKLVIPTIGAIEVDGRTLADVQERVKQAVSRKYLNSEISVDLVMVRGIRVHVTGHVLYPGSYSFPAVHRVADAIEMAGGMTSWAFERGIQVRHADGTSDNVDMHQYKKLGSLEANPYLRGGDVIFVPSINLNHPTVHVEGAVNDPGIYELNGQEKLRDFLLRVGAFSRRTELKYAYLERKTGENGKPEIIAVSKYLESGSNGQADLTLQDGDVLNVPQRLEEVYVIGAVRNPGPYPFIPDLKAVDYVGMAGSSENAAKPGRTKIVRRGSDKQLSALNLPLNPGDVVFVPRRVEFGVREITAIIATAANLLIAAKAVKIF